MSQDIDDSLNPSLGFGLLPFSGWWSGWLAGGLVVLGGVEAEVAEDLAGGGVDDAHVEVGDEDQDGGSGEGSPDADVVEAAVDSQGDAAGFVDAVAPDPPVGVVEDSPTPRRSSVET